MLKSDQKILLLELRNFGDAVILTNLIESLSHSFKGIKIDLFTRPWFKEIFENNPNINKIIYAQFPFMRDKDLNPKTTMHLVMQILRLRMKRYDVCINNQGDFRENLIGCLINPKRNISVRWGIGHEFRNQIRKNDWFNNKNESIGIPNDVINIYDINHYIMKKLGGTELLPPRVYLKNNPVKNGNLIAIHPMAGQACRLWSFEKWSGLIEKLIDKGYKIDIFCAPDEKELIIEKLYKIQRKDKVNMYAGRLDSFFEKLSQASLFIGLDSFSIHLAYALGIPGIMLNGANDYRIFLPKNAYVVLNKESCDKYPCYNKPSCQGSLAEYHCIRGIQVNDVLEKVADWEKENKRKSP